MAVVSLSASARCDSGRRSADLKTRDFGLFRRLCVSALRIALAVGVIFFLLWWFGMRMPGKNVSSAATLSADEMALRAELVADVQKLAGEIGERNMRHYPQLNAAADFIEASFSRAGLQPRRDTYELDGLACHNIEAEIRGTSSGDRGHRRALRFGFRLARRE